MLEIAVSTNSGVEVDRIVLQVLRSVVSCQKPSHLLMSFVSRGTNIPSQWPEEIFRSRNTSDDERYERTLSVAPFRTMVCRTISALKTTCEELHELGRESDTYAVDAQPRWVPESEEPRPCRHHVQHHLLTKLRQ